MKRILLCAIVTGCLAGVATANELHKVPASGAKISLRVLYAGVPAAPRTTEFVAFLEKHFAKVGQAPYSQFTPKMAEGYDVVIFDAEAKPTDSSIGLPKAPKLPMDYDRATVLVAGAGVMAVLPLKTKIDWLCMCMDKGAHDMRLDHEIFHKPLEVEIKYDTFPTPDEYRNRGMKPGDPIKVWNVQTKGFTTGGIAPGVVSMGDGFADSPDAEVISGGINHKSPTGVAIGRHGSFFHWGFSAAPSEMTESGKMAFVNSVVYAAKFDHAPLLVRQNMSGRDRMTWMIGFIGHMKELYADEAKFYEKQALDGKAAREKAKTAPETMTAREKQLARMPARTMETYEQFFKRRSSSFVPAHLVEQFGEDASKYMAWFNENRPYLHANKKFSAELDEELKGLGIPNYDPKLLDVCVKALEEGKDVDRSRHLLERYTGEKFATPHEWRTWLSNVRPELFFSDVGGYRFFSKHGLDAEHRHAVLATSIEEPASDNPVSMSSVVRPETATVGDTVTVAVRLKLSPGWHVCAEAGKGTAAPPTRLEAALPEGVELDGAWRRPEASPQKDGSSIYADDVVFLRNFKLTKSKTGPVDLPVTVSFVACNDERCLPPASVKLTAHVKVLPKANPRRGSD